MESKITRSCWIDASRVFAMHLIILFHLSSSALPPLHDYGYIYSFASFCGFAGSALALFFILSGYFTALPAFSYKKWLIRLVSLAVPYFVWNTLFSVGLNDDCTLSRIYGLGEIDALCADYPLWFVRALFFITLLQPLWRKYTFLWLIVCVCYMFLGNGWPCSFISSLPFPEPKTCSLFLMGACLSLIKIHTLYKYLVISFPLLLILNAVLYCNNFACFQEFAIALNIIRAGLILSFFAFMESKLPFIVNWIAKQNQACFLAYASHAGIIIVLGIILVDKLNINKELLQSMSLFIAILIYYVNVIAFRLLKKYLPFLLPYVAHSGHIISYKRIKD